MDNNFGLFAFLLLNMVVLPLSASVAQVGHGVKKTVKNLCVEGSWIKVGSFRFWKRSQCVKRRQMTPQPTLYDGFWPLHPGLRQREMNAHPVIMKEQSTVDPDLILPSLEGGPERDQHYNPNYGHEPYWEHGDWVFDKDPYKKDSARYMCGVRCPSMYTEYGRVCGRNKDFEYKSFVNYCALKNEDCSNIQRWTLAYKGSCTFKFVPFEQDRVADRAKAIIKELEKKKVFY